MFDVGEFVKNIIIDTLTIPELWMLIVAVLLLYAGFYFVVHSLDKRAQRTWFIKQRTLENLRTLSPDQFEEYTAELFKVMGFKTEIVGGSNDGGIDIIVKKEDVTSFVQCKRYREKNKITPSQVRDFYGGIADKLNGGIGYFVTTSYFTEKAKEFAKERRIELVDGDRLVEYMKQTNVGVSKEGTICPKCGGFLVPRTGKFGSFFGCNNYPKCRYTENPNTTELSQR